MTWRFAELHRTYQTDRRTRYLEIRESAGLESQSKTYGVLWLALLTFNAGVETGQLLFIAAMLAVYAVARRLRVTQPQWAWDLPAYAIGGIAAF